MFIKRGDNSEGKILSVIETEELTDEQKKTAKDLSKKINKTSEKESDTSDVKISGKQ